MRFGFRLEVDDAPAGALVVGEGDGEVVVGEVVVGGVHRGVSKGVCNRITLIPFHLLV
jgi:hypothetical protein